MTFNPGIMGQEPHFIEQVTDFPGHTYTALRSDIASDLYRFCGSKSLISFIKHFFIEKAFNFIVHYRIAHFLFLKREKSHFLYFILSHLFNFHYRKLQVKYCVDINPRCRLGPGLILNHLYGTVIYPDAVLGKNINIGHFVTIGMKDSGRYQGAPTIGNNVYIAPGAKVIGKIRIGNNSTIGANAVVTKDVPDNAIVAGVPAKVIAYSNSNIHLKNLV